MKQYLIYTDESFISGSYYSNFYGGALVDYTQLQKINSILNRKKEELHLNAEIKWSKMSPTYLNKYIQMIDLFFYLIKIGKIRIRIMFRQNARIPSVPLTKEKYDNQYYLLYYQFIKNAFGFDYCPDNKVKLKLYFDQFPDKRDKSLEFKEHVLFLNNLFTNIIIQPEDVVEINSKDHVIQQCMDIILGSINFRLNDLYLRKDPVSNKRGKTTIAKEKLYKVILHHIQEIHPNFNIGVSTNYGSDKLNIWLDPYRHWAFTPKNSYLDSSKTKKQKNNSTLPT